MPAFVQRDKRNGEQYHQSNNDRSPMSTPEMARTLARYIVSASHENLAEKVCKEGVRTLLNWVGGSGHETVNIAVDALAPFSSPAQATISWAPRTSGRTGGFGDTCARRISSSKRNEFSECPCSGKCSKDFFASSTSGLSAKTRNKGTDHVPGTRRMLRQNWTNYPRLES
jgi:hypothetical protein